MKPYPRIWLKKGKSAAVLRRHHWIFSGAIKKKESEIGNMHLVEVYSHKDEYLCTGMYHDASIALRILSFEKENIDQTYWNGRLQSALTMRSALGLPNKKTNIFRLFHGEGDGVPGLVIDIYNNAVVIQLHYEGLNQYLPNIKRAIKNLPLEIKDIIIKQTFDNTQEEISQSHVIQAWEDGIQYEIDLVQGQKTGFFIDQRDNRSLLNQYAKGKKILNLFSYNGGFSMQALAGGASFVDSIDISKTAIASLQNNLKLNDFDSGKHVSHTEDVLAYITQLELDHDIIVVDPPAFAKHKSKRHNAIQAYKRLNLNVFKNAKAGALVFSFSCSQVITKDIFRKTIYSAALESNRSIKILKELNQAKDHPVNIFHPETDYLKGLLIYLG